MCSLFKEQSILSRETIHNVFFFLQNYALFFHIDFLSSIPKPSIGTRMRCSCSILLSTLPMKYSSICDPVIMCRLQILSVGTSLRLNPMIMYMYLTPFPNKFSYIAAASAPFHAFLNFLLRVFRTIYLPNQWLLSCTTILQTMVSGEKINPLPDMPILGSSNSAANKNIMSKIWTKWDTII